jgi:hypothetical protein
VAAPPDPVGQEPAPLNTACGGKCHAGRRSSAFTPETRGNAGPRIVQARTTGARPGWRAAASS